MIRGSRSSRDPLVEQAVGPCLPVPPADVILRWPRLPGPVRPCRSQAARYADSGGPHVAHHPPEPAHPVGRPGQYGRETGPPPGQTGRPATPTAHAGRPKPLPRFEGMSAARMAWGGVRRAIRAVVRCSWHLPWTRRRIGAEAAVGTDVGWPRSQFRLRGQRQCSRLRR
jgi:hypothetical protein